MTRRTLIVSSIVLATAATLLVAELGLRIFQRVAHGTPMASFLPSYKETRFQMSPFLVFGPRMDWQIPNKTYPAYAYFNAQGFRTADPVGKKAKGEYRIVTLGGSTTEDLWNEAGIHWPLVLELELRRQGHGAVRVLNTGMSAYTSAHSLVRYQFDVVEHEPDMIIVMHNINDLLVNYAAARATKAVDPHYKVPYGTKPYTGEISDDDIVLSRVVHSVTSRLKHWRDNASRQSIPDADISGGRAYFKRNLVHLVSLARSNGTAPVLLTMPIAKSRRVFDGTARQDRPFPRHERFLDDFASYNEAIREVGREHGATVIDMEALLGSDEAHFVDVVHYSTGGSIAFGTALAARLSALIR